MNAIGRRRSLQCALLGSHPETTRAALRMAGVEVLEVGSAGEIVRLPASGRPELVLVDSSYLGLVAVVTELSDAGARVLVVDRGQLGPARLLELGRVGARAIWDGRSETLASASSEADIDHGSASGVHRAQDRFRRLLRSVPAAVWTFDLQECHDAVAAMTNAFGFDDALTSCLDHVRARPLNDSAASYAGAEAAIAEVLLRAWYSGDRVPRVEVDVPRAGTTRTLLVSAAMPTGNDFRQVLVVGLDTTEHRALTRALVASQRLQAVGRLAGGIAHDFKNILTIIRSYIDLVSDEVAPDSPAQNDLEVMRDATERASTLIAQLVTFSGKRPQPLQRLDLNEIVSGLEKLVARPLGDDIELQLDLTPTPLPIMGDRSQIEQVLLNLAVNARDAMPHGGRLRFRTLLRRRTDSWTHPVGFRVPAGTYAHIEVVDDGVGMTREVLEQIFEPFFTTKADRGSGLGLATAYGIVKQHGGYITATSQVGSGTTFELLLPLLRASDMATRRPDHAFFPSGEPAAKQQVLLVEDDPDVRRELGDALEKCGFVVHASGDPERVLAWVDDETLLFDVLITDVLLPTTNGAALAARVRRARPEVALVLMSGREDDDSLAGAFPESEAVFLRKPASVEALVRAVGDSLALARGPRR